MPTKVAFYYDTHKKNTKILSLKTAHTSACLVKEQSRRNYVQRFSDCSSTPYHIFSRANGCQRHTGRTVKPV